LYGVRHQSPIHPAHRNVNIYAVSTRLLEGVYKPAAPSSGNELDVSLNWNYKDYSFDRANNRSDFLQNSLRFVDLTVSQT
jgi:hypothetical protein